MSLEAWGDGGDEESYDHLLDAGWWTSEQVDEVKDQIKALLKEQIYEGGMMEKGVNVKFLARITLLTHAAGLSVPPDLLAEAQAMLSPKTAD